MILAYKFIFSIDEKEKFGKIITEQVIVQRKIDGERDIAKRAVEGVTWDEKYNPHTGDRIFSSEPVVVFKWAQWMEFMNKLRLSQKLVDTSAAANLVLELVSMLENSEF